MHPLWSTNKSIKASSYYHKILFRAHAHPTKTMEISLFYSKSRIHRIEMNRELKSSRPAWSGSQNFSYKRLSISFGLYLVPRPHTGVLFTLTILCFVYFSLNLFNNETYQATAIKHSRSLAQRAISTVIMFGDLF